MVKTNLGRLREPYPIMKYIQLYLFATIGLYLLGPVDWKTRLPLLTFALVIVYQLSLYYGYKRGSSKEVYSYSGSFFSYSSFRRYYWTFAIVVLVVSSLRIIRIAQLYGFSGISSLVETAIMSASDIYRADKTATTGDQMFGGTLLSILAGVVGPFSVMFIPMSVVCFKELSLSKKLIGVLTIIVFSLSKLVAGTNEGFFEPVLYLIVGFVLRSSTRQHSTKRNRNWIWLIVGVVAIVYLFNLVMTDRNGTFYEFGQLGENQISPNKGLINYVPEGLKILFIWLTFYITQGYYGMSLALTGDWHPMFGAGFSSYLRSNLQPLFSHDLAQDTLMYSTNPYGWIYGVNWHTAYTWFASDVWWPGVIFIMLGMGYLFGRVFKEAYYTRNPISVGLFALLVMFCIFIPANNKIFANSDTFFAFFVYLFIWLSRKLKRKAQDY